MRVVVTGGRAYLDREKLEATLNKLDITTLAHGDCRSGADRLADEWARRHGIHCDTFPATWNVSGPGAGPMRNSRMLRVFQPDMVVAFPGGRGTADCVRKARAAGIVVLEVGV